jgi:hypothetical protein
VAETEDQEMQRVQLLAPIQFDLKIDGKTLAQAVTDVIEDLKLSPC